MSETKFLNDGRKVAIIGKLNNTEWIVKEVFVTESGDEIPSGESFTTKSVHDTPVESYYKKEERRQKESTHRAKQELEKTRKEIKKYNDLLKAKKDILANSPELKDLVGDKARILAMFMTGTVNYLVLDNYRLTKPVKMEDQIISFDSGWGERRYEAIKLCSVLGKSGGELEYRIHRYCDGSGSSDTTVYPFETHEEAVEKIKQLALAKLAKGYFYHEDYDVCKDLAISFSADEREKIYDLLSKGLISQVESAKTSVVKYQQEQLDTVKKLETLKNEILVA